MYGTIARMRTKPGESQRFTEQMASFERLGVPGFVGAHLYRSDNDPDELWLVVMFEDRESYERNADDPAQHERYLAYRQFLAAEPEWHDGEIIHSQTAVAAAR